jgi:hypothetical protein
MQTTYERDDLSFVPPDMWLDTSLAVFAAPAGQIIRVGREPMRDETLRGHIDHSLAALARDIVHPLVIQETGPMQVAGRAATRVRFVAGALEQTLVFVGPREGEEPLVTIFNLVREAEGKDDARAAFEDLLRSAEL